ncbi:hypothetical protein G6514_001476 [Epicoccum nigrum]|nr:hypothetical protein G6514_001476 [Epicoccum nigrum]
MKQTIAFSLSIATLVFALPRQNEARQLQNLQLVCDGISISTDAASQPTLPLPPSNPIGDVISSISDILPQPNAYYVPNINTLISRIVSEVLATATGAINPTAITSIVGDVVPTDPVVILDPINSAVSSIIADLPTGGVSNSTAIIDPVVGVATSIIGNVLPEATSLPTAVIDPILSAATSVIGGVIPEVTGAPLASAIGSLPSAIISAVDSIMPPLENAVAGLPTSFIGDMILEPTAALVVTAIGSLPSAVISAVDSIIPPFERAVAGIPTILPGTDGPACSLIPTATVPGLMEPVLSAVNTIVTPLPSVVGGILEPVPEIVQPVASAMTAVVAPVETAIAGAVRPIASVVEGVVGGLLGGDQAAPAISTLTPVTMIPVPAASTLLTVVSLIVSAVPAPTIAPRVPFCCPVSVLGVVSSTYTVATEASVCVGGAKKTCVSAFLNPGTSVNIAQLTCFASLLGVV